MKKSNSAKKLTFIVLLLIGTSNIFAQCPLASFQTDPVVCSGTPLNLINNSQNASSYAWDFTPGFFNTPGIALTPFATGNSFNLKDLIVKEQNDTIIAFIATGTQDKITRVVYPNGAFTISPVMEDLSFPGLLSNPSDIDLFEENNEWYGLIADKSNASLIRFHLGSSLLNAPDNIVQVLNSSNSNMIDPWSLKIIKDSLNDVYAMVTNFTNGSFTMISFGNSITNLPTAGPITSIPGFGYVLDGIIQKECGNYFGFFAGFSSGLITKADFGNSLTNTPVFTNIITDGSPSDLALVQDSSHWKLLYTNWNTYELHKYDLGSSLSNTSPVLIGHEDFNLHNPKGISILRKNNSEFVFINNTNTGDISLIQFSNQIAVSNQTSTDSLPVVSFNHPGLYPITLTVTDTYGNSSAYTDTVRVLDAPTSHFGFVNNCLGDTMNFIDSTFIPGAGISSWQWDFGDGQTDNIQNPSHFYATAGTYTVTLTTTSGICSNSISRLVNISPVPVAAFSTLPGCSNIATPFSDASTLASGTITGWEWHFGTGDSSTAQNPLYSFPTGGTYLVSLTVLSDAGCTSDYSQNVLVQSGPIVAFVASNTCIGQTVQFTDQSLSNGSVINTYSWDFGDGNFDNTANPSHTYSASIASYNVQLAVSAINGCADTLSKEIKINNIPVASFVSASSICQGTALQFTDASYVSGDTLSGWLWDFGDSQFDTIQSPSHIFTLPGTYNVQLVAYSPSSCPSAPFQQTITVHESPVSSFNYSGICQNSQTTLNSTSTPAPGTTISSYLWFLTPTDSAFFPTSYHTFTSSGNFPVTLTVTASDGCSSSTTIPVNISATPQASFSSSLGCTNQNVQFTNSSTCDTSNTLQQYYWNFADFSFPGTNLSTLTNPTHSYINSSSYTVSLIAVTNVGCSDTAFNYIAVHPSAPVQFTYSPTCFGSLMEFFNPGSPLDSTYLWNFGDYQTNQLKEPVHYYASSGNYTVTLKVTTNSGCISTASKIVNVSPIPIAEFLATPGCVDANYLFQNQSTVNTGSITAYDWNILEDTVHLTAMNPDYTFQDTGVYHVALTVTSDIGCTKSISHPVTIHSLPTANFGMTPQFGNPPLDVQFSDYSTGAASYTWNFGTDTTHNYQQEPTYVYADTGLFMITQIVTSAYGCIDTATKNIYVIKPVLDIAVTGDSSYFAGEYFHIVAHLANLGTREINSLNLQARIDDGNVIQEELLRSIPSGPEGIQIYEFNAAFRITDLSSFNYYCIEALDPNGETDNNSTNNEICNNNTSDIAILGPYPNPAVDESSIRLISPNKNKMTITVYDQLGQSVILLYDGKAQIGLNEFDINTGSLNSGLYTIQIIFGQSTYHRQLVLNKTRK